MLDFHTPTRAPIRSMVLATALLLFACSKDRPTVTITVKKSDIQQRLDAKFPVTKSKFLSDVTLKNPRVVLEDGSDTIGLDLDVEVAVPVLGKFTGSLRASGKISYEFEDKAFYLLEPSVEKITIDGLPEDKLEKARKPIEVVAANYLRAHPVYEFKGRNLKELTAEYVLRSVLVESGELKAVIAPPF